MNILTFAEKKNKIVAIKALKKCFKECYEQDSHWEDYSTVIDFLTGGVALVKREDAELALDNILSESFAPEGAVAVLRRRIAA